LIFSLIYFGLNYIETACYTY